MTPRSPLARANAAWLAIPAALTVLALLAWPLLPRRAAGKPLVVFCAASLKTPLETVAREYRRESGIEVQFQFGGSQTLLANLEIARRGDLFLPADESYLALARDKGLVAEVLPLTRMTPVIAVRKGNPKGIHSLADLLRGDVRLAQTNPDAAATGKLTRETLSKTGQWEPLRARTLVFKPTVNDVANDVKLGTVDAGIVFDAVARQYPDLEIVAVPELAAARAHVAIGVLSSGTQAAAALHFARYLAARDKGLRIFQQSGYEIVEEKP